MHRTRKSARNVLVALILFAINLILQFISRKVFIDSLGTEVLGLNTTVTSILQFLNISELGISSAVACTLYKPLYDRDSKAVNEIVSIHGWLYRKVGLLVTALSCCVLFLIPLIFAKSSLPLWYAYASFVVLLLGNLPGYFINFDQVLLSADQNDYKIQYAYKLPMALKVLCQTISVYYLPNGYFWWLFWELVFAVISSYLLKRTVLKSYPELEVKLSDAKVYIRQHEGVLAKVKQLFVHKISSFALSQLSPIIIYALATLSLVTIYGNYMLIVFGVTSLLNALFNSIGAGVGNLIAENDKPHILDVFSELFTSRFFMVCVCAVTIYYQADSFITLWVGNEFVLDNISLIFMLFIFYITTMRSVVDSFLNAYGLFADIWAPITETILNLSLSLLLGKFFGLPGILAGVVISLFLIVFIWKPVYLFKKGLGVSIGFYIKKYIKHIFFFVLSFSIFRALYSLISLHPADSVLAFVYSAVVQVLMISIPLFVLLYLFDKGMRNFVRRMLSLIKKRVI